MTDTPVLALVGPTASGKSAVALDVAETARAAGVDVELVAVDAFTIYEGMVVGTAAPDAQERARVPHHLVGVLAPDEEVTVAWFQAEARAVVARLRAAGTVPLLVGGSGLYFRAVVDDLRFPPTDEAVRAALEARYADDPERAHAHLTAVDPEAAAKIEPGNLRRSVRALEVLELTGERFSSFADAWDRHTSVVGPLTVAMLDLPTPLLRERIDRRAEAMVAGGLLEEAAALRARPGGLSRTARQAIGYAEAFAVLDGDAPVHGLAASVADRTWRYARRQRAWFRRDPRCDGAEPDRVRRTLLDALGLHP
ncbi:MAG: tRNA (adenosine(37)-N6)-dimethylallyltransferase MiaA [Actinomycetes bacterium]